MTTLPFADRLLDWFDRHGRHDLPWQHPREAYRVWISEVMLQQTQVATVIPYFERFMARFPTVTSLAEAPQDEVLRHWAGLGYYARARNLHAAAKQIATQHGGRFPDHYDAVSELPGIGRSTAGAILAQAHGQRIAILDGNVRRVLARHAGIAGWPGQPRVQAQLWDIAEQHLPQLRLADYTQATMDLGNSVCRSRAPLCLLCPVGEDCVARREDLVSALPSPKPTRARKQRSTQILLIRDAQGQILVRRRPPVGIWGGLYCPPLVAEGDSLETAIDDAGGRPQTAQGLPPIHHAFTHFDLELQPLLLDADGQAAKPGIAESDERVWIKLSDPGSWPGLPAPVRKLLESLDPPTGLPDSAKNSSQETSPCPAPSTASSSTSKPKGSTARPTPARSASASSTTSRRKPGSSGSSTRRD
ncbi:A/G-specific adenine glycosylase [Panacagrimonas perspica]|nr:A/G-specific adenine glycosylase [Panacagrimonas perspica]